MSEEKKAKTKQVSPTVKQRKAFKNIMENHGNVSKAMRDAGYDPSTAKNPKNLTESQGFLELMTELGLDDKTLIKKHKQLLNSSNIDRFTFDGDVDDDIIRETFAEIPGVKVLYIRYYENSNTGAIESKTAYIRVPDTIAQDKALDKAYKLKGSYAPEKSANVSVSFTKTVTEERKKYDL